MKIQIKATIHVDTDNFEGEFTTDSFELWGNLENYVTQIMNKYWLDIDLEDMYVI